MRIIRIIILIVTIYIFSGCEKKYEKCVKIIDENNRTMSNVKVSFSAMKKRNNTVLGNMITTFNPFHEIDIPLSNKKDNKVCFENYKYKDEEFLYNDLRSWKIYNDRYEVNYDSFDVIPSKIILRK